MSNNIFADYSIPPRSRHDFTTYHNFRKFLEESLKAWQDGHGRQYIAAQNITPQVIEWIDKKRHDLP